MNAHAITIRLRLDAPELVLRDVVPVFHRWIREETLSSELLIDVADYSHVFRGPGVLLVCHESHVGIDDSDGRLGLTYSRKREAEPVAPKRRCVEAAHRALTAAHALEGSVELSGRLRIRTDVWEIRVADRLRAPNTAETFARLEPELRTFFQLLFDDAVFELEHLAAAKRLFAVRATVETEVDVSVLLARLDAWRAVA